MNAFTIRPLDSQEDYIACENLQQEVWGFSEREIVPSVELKSTRQAGGIVSGAFEDDGGLVGFVVGFWALDDDGRVYLYSRRLGVRPSHRGRGIGARLKEAQRAYTLSRGFDRVCWTFDPLEGVNAKLNLGHLGVVAKGYFVDYYGSSQPGINFGLPTDRFFVHWDVDSTRVRRRVDDRVAAPDFDAVQAAGPSMLRDEDGAPRLLQDPTSVDGPVHMEIPSSIAVLKASKPDRAMAWRLAVRDVSLPLIERGFQVTEFASAVRDGFRRSAYLFERGA